MVAELPDEIGLGAVEVADETGRVCGVMEEVGQDIATDQEGSLHGPSLPNLCTCCG